MTRISFEVMPGESRPAPFVLALRPYLLPRQTFGAAMGAMARWPITAAGRAAETKMVADGIWDADTLPGDNG